MLHERFQAFTQNAKISRSNARAKSRKDLCISLKSSGISHFVDAERKRATYDDIDISTRYDRIDQS